MEAKLLSEERLFSNKDLWKLFIPLIIEQFLEYLVGLADSIMVASVGEASVSGVSLVDFVMALLISIFSALSTGGAVIASQYFGKKQIKESKEASNQLVWFTGIISVIIMLLVYGSKSFILNNLFGDISPEVKYEANTYLMITAISIPFLALYNSGAAIFRTIGNSKLPMKIMLYMNIAHALGNAILIYGFNFGIEGVAIPTLISRVFAAIIIIYMALNKKNPIHINRSFKYKFDFPMIKRILGIGIPYGLENGLFFFGRIIVLGLVASFGTASIAANAVSGTIVMFQVLPGMAIGMGLTVIIARCVGAGDFNQAKYYTKKVISIVYVAQIISCIVVLVLLPSILNIYGLSDSANAMIEKNLWWHGVMMVLIWPLAYTLPITFRASGDARFPMMVGILAMFLCRIAFAFLLCKYFNFGMFGTWLAMFIDWIVKAALYVHRYFNEKWTTYRAIA